MRRVATLVVTILACGARTPLGDGVHGDASVDVGAQPADAHAEASIDAAADGPIFGIVAAPHAIAPLSTQTTTTRRPTFRWVLPSGVDGARVELCADRACTKPEMSFDTLGASGKVPSDLDPGLHFYRLRGIVGSTLGADTDATREFVVPHRSTPRDTSWGSFPDFDGDGYADVVATGRSGPAWNELTQAPLTVFPGSPDGIHHKVRVEIPTSTFIEQLAVAGDVDGDGLVDLVLVMFDGFPATSISLILCRGTSSGMLSAPATIDTLIDGAGFRDIAAGGDVNGDGYADVIAVDGDSTSTGHVRLYYGSTTGLAPGPVVTTFSTDYPFGAARELGDFDGDGVGDIVIGNRKSVDVLFGSTSGLGVPMSMVPCAAAIPSITPGDLDGDGIPDLAGGSSCGFGILYGGTKMTTQTMLSKPSGHASLGSTFAIAGDVDGDGYDDLVTSLGDLAGMISYGSSAGVSDGHRAIFTAPHASNGIVAAAGDLDRDGYMDVLLGETMNAYNWLYEFDGSPSGPVQKTIVSPLVPGTWAEQTQIR